MGHVIAPGIGTASLDGFGGLITQINPSDLPENASPRTWDTDFIVGSVFTRPGLASVYVFTATILINAVVFTSGNIATFYYSGKQPLINEQYVLSGFTGSASFLNGLTVTVESSTPVSFQVVMTGTGTYAGLSGTGTSTTGDFVGPNLGGNAAVVPPTGAPWSNPTAILGSVGFASTITGAHSEGETPGDVVNFPTSPSGAPWNNPGNATATGAMVATVTNTTQSGSEYLSASGMAFAIPSGAIVTGVQVSFSASGQKIGGGVPAISVALGTSGAPGNTNSVPVTATMSPITIGGSTYQWYLTQSELTALVENPTFSVFLQAFGAVGSNFSLNSLVVVAYYTVPASEPLNDTEFNFSIPATSGISGFGVTFQAFSSAATTVSMQLLKNGVAVGTPETQVLTTAHTVYTLGSPFDLWGSTWLSSDTNSTNFGVQIVASGNGTTSINDVDMIVYLTPGLNNFNYIKSYIQDNGQIDTLALDSSGILWKEDVTNNPGVLSIALTGILPGSFAKSATADDQEYILFSNEAVGTDRPRVYNGTLFTPLSQVGPGAPPTFAPATGISGGTTLTITAYQITANVVTYTFVTGPVVSQDQMYNVTYAVPNFLNIVGVVLGVPAPTATTFSMTLVHPDVPLTQIVPNPTGPQATGTLQFNYPILSITQNPSHPYNGGSSGGIFWGANPGPTHTAGTNLYFYYSQTEDTVLDQYFAAHQQSTFVYIGALPGYPQFANQTYLVTAVGNAKPSSTAGAPRFYFAVNVGVSGMSYQQANVGTYQMTIATITTSEAIGGLNTGDTIQITGETPTAWNGSWAIVAALKSSNLNIITTSMSATGVATYTFSLPAGGVNPVNGQTVSVIGATNSAAGYTLSPFNVVGTLVYPGSSGAGSFDIDGFTSQLPIATALDDSARASTFGTQFSIDPGQVTIGSANSPIYGNAGATVTPGGIYIVNGQGFTPITSGTRQAVVFFITSTGYETTMSPPVVFTVPSNTTSIQGTSIPIGPPNTVARGIAFTEAGQNGIPGANFYVIPNPVTVQVLNGAPVTYKPTIIYDNTSQYMNFTFTDAVLLNSTAVDIQGNDLFNLIELGSSAWCVPYASRMFYGLQLNKVDNFLNLTFDGGYIPPNPGNNIAPLGWQSQVGNANVTLLNSPVTGMAAYFFNTTGAVVHTAGLMGQPAFQDTDKVPIIKASTTYSVRVTASCPSGNQVGTLTLSLVTYDPNLGYGVTYNTSTFTVPLTSMSTNMQVFTGPLLSVPFTQSTAQVWSPVPDNLFLQLQVAELGPGADCLVDRIEVFPTLQPYLLAQVYGSYVDNLEAVDASGSGGIVDTSAINPQPCMGGFVMHDVLYLLKTDSMVSTEDNPSSEPGGWGVHEVSNKVGSIGISSYDVGEENCTMACRDGIYGFNGGQPVKLMQEIWQVWNLINWYAGNTIVLKNDIVNRRILCAVPLATPNQWLPFDPVNLAPTSPNVILMCNYQGLNTFDEMLASPQMHTTMFGTLAAVDMKRKWSIWHIKTPYMDFISRQDVEDKPLFICNGIDSSKIYQFLDDQLSDDGVAIYGLYTTYGFVNAAKAATLPIFGFHQKRYTVLQGTSYGAGVMKVVAYQNTLGATYPYTVPGGITNTPVMQGDWFRTLNQRGSRIFLEFSTDAVGSWFNLSKLLLSGKADNFTLNPTGGGNQGFPSGTK